jgi:mannose-6-phosphate isomerase-like protein (cupin superfamily)
MTVHSPIACSVVEHYTWGGNCEGWRFLDEADMSVIVERIPSGASESTHLHRQARQLFFVLDGRVSLQIGDATVRIAQGEAVHVPPGTAHRVFNDSGADTRLLVISSAPARFDRHAPDVAPAWPS